MKALILIIDNLILPTLYIALVIIAGHFDIEYAENLLTFMTVIGFVALIIVVAGDFEPTISKVKFLTSYRAFTYVFMVVGCAWYGWFFLATAWLFGAIYVLPKLFHSNGPITNNQ